MRNIFDFYTPKVLAPLSARGAGDVSQENYPASFADSALGRWSTFSTDLTHNGDVYTGAQLNLRHVVYTAADQVDIDGTKTTDELFPVPLPAARFATPDTGLSSQSVSYFGFDGLAPRAMLVTQVLFSSGNATDGTYANVYIVGRGWLWSAPRRIAIPALEYASLTRVHPVAQFAPDGALLRVTLFNIGSSYNGGVWVTSIIAAVNGGSVTTTEHGPRECMSMGSQLLDSLNNVSTAYGNDAGIDYAARDGIRASVLVAPTDASKVVLLLETDIRDPLTGIDGPASANRTAVFAALPELKRVFFLGECLNGTYTEADFAGDFTPFVQADGFSYTGQATSDALFEDTANASFNSFSGSARKASSSETRAFDVDVAAVYALVSGYQDTVDGGLITANYATTTRTAVALTKAATAGVFAVSVPHSAVAVTLAEFHTGALARRQPVEAVGNDAFNPVLKPLFTARGTCVSVAVSREAGGSRYAHGLFAGLAFNSAAHLDDTLYVMTPDGLVALDSAQHPNAVLAGVLASANNMRCGQLRAVAGTAPHTTTSMKLGGTTWYRYPTDPTPGGARAVLGRGAQGRTASFVVRGLQGDVGAVVVDVVADERFKRG